jgi:putative iron-regulated protein
MMRLVLVGAMATWSLISTVPLSPSFASQKNTAEFLTSWSEQRQELAIASVVDQVIIPTYQDLYLRSVDLAVAIQNLADQPDKKTLKAAQKAWKEARLYWEQGESFLFGPVDSLGIDPALDTWPIEEEALEAALPELSGKAAADLWSVDPSLKGFHSMEYLLFGERSKKKIKDFSLIEYQYLQGLADHQVILTEMLLESWTHGVRGLRAYADVLKSAGAEDNLFYDSPQAVIEEILEGMVAIADELANEKIGEPLLSGDVTLLESRFSRNSVEDFANNLRGMRYVYFGQRSDIPAEHSISQLIAALSPDLDQLLQDALESSLLALEAIDKPIEVALGHPKHGSAVEKAHEEIIDLFELLDGDVRSLVLQWSRG